MASAIDAEVTRAVCAVDAATRSRIVDGIAAGVAQIDRWPVPETFAHGDFHPGNVAAGERGLAIIFDWSDACFTTPLVDVATWTWWCTDNAERQAFVWSCFESAWRREFGHDSAVANRRVISAVAAGFHLVSYVEICEALEPAARVEHQEGLTHFTELLVESCR